MSSNRRLRLGLATSILLLVFCASGCTSFRDYFRQGFKVGPNYCQPNAPVAEHWIDASDVHACENPEILRHWWTVFDDPTLDKLIECAYCQNLTLREAGARILQARSALDITIGNIFPQSQTASGSYTRRAGAIVGPNPAAITGVTRYTDLWNLGFNLQWELDFWGRFRRAIAAADANLDAAVYDYDFVLVTLLGDVAQNYVTYRTTQRRIDLLRANTRLQRDVYEWLKTRQEAGYKLTKLDSQQALANLKQTEAGIPQLEILKRQSQNALCVLLGIPTVDLKDMLVTAPDHADWIETHSLRETVRIKTVKIPAPRSPAEVIIGIPADLLRRRPDVRRAERLAAAQAEQIGIAESALYPAFFINGNFGYTAQNFPDLFRNTAFNGSVGPSFQWSILEYGRIVNNVKLQDAKLQELILAYQNKVLDADREVEDGLVTYLQAQRGNKLLDESVKAAKDAVQVALTQYTGGGVGTVPGLASAGDFNRYALIEQNLVTQEDQWAQTQGQISQGLIQVYRALGGGWELGLGEGQPQMLPQMPPPGTVPNIPGIGVPPKSPPPVGPESSEAVPTPIPDAPVIPKDSELPNPPTTSKASRVPAESETFSEPIIAKQTELSAEPLADKDINLLREPAAAKKTPTQAKPPAELKMPTEVKAPAELKTPAELKLPPMPKDFETALESPTPKKLTLPKATRAILPSAPTPPDLKSSGTDNRS
jgi:outer membrane protein TolC